MTIPADNPIKSKDEDQLGRARIAEILAREIRGIDASVGCVVGILGEWGSGKTSLVNMIRGELLQTPSLSILEFNPWMFSGTDELLESFFLEIGAQFRSRGERLAELAEDMEAYGEVIAPLRLLPIVGVWVERARTTVKGVRKALERRKGGALAKRNQLAKRLAELEHPIVIVIDDLDRLRTSEIRDIFKLVRLTANFPNIIYIVAFDRHRVEAALSEEGLVGRDYLEKILQVAYDIPSIPETILTRRLTTELDNALRGIEEPGPFNAQTWPDVFFEVIRPVIRNMRDVRRYVASIHGTVLALEGRVALVDALALEAIRIFLPDAFKALVQAQEGLTSPRQIGMYSQDPPRLKNSIDQLMAAAGNYADVLRSAITRLFPAGRRHIENMTYGPEWQKQWLRERRIAHSEILKFYLERVVGEQLEAFALAEQAFALLADEPGLGAFLDSLDDARLGDAIAALEAYEDDFPATVVESACTVLLNQIGRVPERPGGFLTLAADIIVGRVILRLLRRVEDPVELEGVVRRVLAKVSALSDRFELITLVGHRENAGHRLVPEDVAEELEKNLRSQVRSADANTLAAEHDLVGLLLWTKTKAGASEPPLEVPKDRRVDKRLLLTAVTKSQSRALDSRAVRKRKQLYWESLVEITGGESGVQEMIDRITAAPSDDDELDEAVDLARRYLTGWRPERHEDD